MEAVEIAESHSSSGFSRGPPWLFKGRALYQLHLVKAEVARKFIPNEFKLVEAFGYTLGGMFLANYDDSPAGKFDELVVLAGIVWNPPTSCAWAARVLVSSHEACKHGRKEVGLPSHFAEFSKISKQKSQVPGSSSFNFQSSQEGQTEIQVIDDIDSTAKGLCSITLPFAGLEKSIGPNIKLSLPSFSGKTVDNPHLLKYSCHIECRMRTVEAAKISMPFTDKSTQKNDDLDSNRSIVLTEDDKRNLSISILLSKPILALEFSSLKMQVEAPIILSCTGTAN